MTGCCTLEQVSENWLCQQIDQLMDKENPEGAEAVCRKLAELEQENRKAAASLLGIPFPPLTFVIILTQSVDKPIWPEERGFFTSY